MSETPTELKYTSSHEWLRLEKDGSATIGITDHAQNLLGDLVFVEMPELERALESGEECAVVESVKAASDIYSPIAGRVCAINEALADSPETVNQTPYTEGWLFRLQDIDPAACDKLMDATAYAATITSEEE